jgi:orotidine-5'-phosphate decarboxylase
VPTQRRSGKERIILPLDFPSFDQAQATVKQLKDHVGLFKVGLTLYLKEGKRILDYLQGEVGADRVFLDLKFLDIPETVANASAVIDAFHPKFVTVHASQGAAVLKAAVDALRSGSQVLAVTVLTSANDAELKALKIDQTVQERVLMLAQMAKEAKCGGVICSGLEARDVKNQCGPNFIVVTPGIRPAWAEVSKDDQKRKMTPGQAIQNGADYIVVGRPISASADRVAAARKIAEEIEQALSTSPPPK